MKLIDMGAGLKNYVHDYAERYDDPPEMSKAGGEQLRQGQDILIGGLGGLAVGIGLYEAGKLSEERPLARVGGLAILGSAGAILKSASKLFYGNLIRSTADDIVEYEKKGLLKILPSPKRTRNILEF